MNVEEPKHSRVLTGRKIKPHVMSSGFVHFCEPTQFSSTLTDLWPKDWEETLRPTHRQVGQKKNIHLKVTELMRPS